MGALSGKKVIVIGGSAGIGMATAAHALRAGAEVALSARGAERLQRAAGTLAKEGGCITHETLDMRDRAAVSAYLARQAPFDHLAQGHVLGQGRGGNQLHDDLAGHIFGPGMGAARGLGDGHESHAKATHGPGSLQVLRQLRGAVTT